MLPNFLWRTKNFTTFFLLNSDEALEKFFGQARQRRGGNLYIDVVDIMAAGKIVNLQTLIKHEIMPESSYRELDCYKNCTTSENSAERSELIDEITPQDTQELLRSDDIWPDTLFINMLIALVTRRSLVMKIVTRCHLSS